MRDHSCYIAIQNNLDVDMTLVGFGTAHGYFATLPADTIAPRTISPLLHVKDSWGIVALHILCMDLKLTGFQVVMAQKVGFSIELSLQKF